jgi:hypothetical protein
MNLEFKYQVSKCYIYIYIYIIFFQNKIIFFRIEISIFIFELKNQSSNINFEIYFMNNIRTYAYYIYIILIHTLKYIPM